LIITFYNWGYPW